MADKSKLIDINGLSVFLEGVREEMSEIGGKTYTLTKNESNEIVLSCGDGNDTKVTDSNTTYSFDEDTSNHTLTITASDGTSKTINLGSEVTSSAIETALGFMPKDAEINYSNIKATIKIGENTISINNDGISIGDFTFLPNEYYYEDYE